MITDFSDAGLDIPDFPNSPSAGAACGPSLDTEETLEQSADSSSYRHFVTSGCRRQIESARRVYKSLDDDKAKKRLLAFDSCRSSAYFVRHAKTGMIRVASSRCGQRWCPLCIRVKRYIIQTTVGAWIRAVKQPKFLTLTLKHTSAPLEHQIDILYKCFKELRRQPYIKSHVKGGIWFFQVKLSRTDGLWHPHIHILFEGRFLEHAKVKALWSKITHGSTIVDIRAVKDQKKAADYVARYAAAPCELSDLDHSSAVECVKALHSRRICGTFGTGRTIKLTPKPPEDAKEWKFIGSFQSVINMSFSIETMAQVVKCWKSGEYCSYVPPDPDPEPNKLDMSLKAEPEPFRQPEFKFCL
jgi:hypothetical protein